MNTSTISISSQAISANTLTFLSAAPIKGRTLVTLDLVGINEIQYAVNNININWGDENVVYSYSKDVVPNYYSMSIFDELLYGKLGGSIAKQYTHAYNSLPSYDMVTYLLDVVIYYENGYTNTFNIYLPVYPESYYDTLDELDILTTQIVPLSTNYTFANLESKKTGQTLVCVLSVGYTNIFALTSNILPPITPPIPPPSSAAVAATLTVDSTGPNNTILYTAINPGLSGNTISIAYSGTAVDVTRIRTTGTSITAVPGTKERMIITGTSSIVSGLTSPGGGVLKYSGTNFTSFPYWTSSGLPLDYGALSSINPITILRWNGSGGRWIIEAYAGDGSSGLTARTFFAVSNSGPAWPDLTTWGVPSIGGGGAPTITAATTTALEIIKNINRTGTTSASLVSASAVGDVTGTVSTFTRTFLSGGADAIIP